MPTSYKHLLVISDGELLESSLHHTERERAERVIQLINDDEIGDGELSNDVDEVMEEAETDAYQADYPEGAAPPSRLNPEDYLDALREFLSSRGIDLYLDELSVPETATAEAVGTE